MRRMRRIALQTVVVLACVVPAAQAAAEQYAVDPVHSGVWFRIMHLGASYAYGAFIDLSGNVQFDPKKPEASKIAIAVKTDSVETFNDQRDEHLRSPDFFDSAQFPEMKFISTSWKPVKDNIYEVAGNLTLRGVTKPITFEAEFVGTGTGKDGEQRAGFETVFTIKRSDFGMTKYMPPVLSDDVRITVSLEGVKK